MRGPVGARPVVRHPALNTWSRSARRSAVTWCQYGTTRSMFRSVTNGEGPTMVVNRDPGGSDAGRLWASSTPRPALPPES